MSAPTKIGGDTLAKPEYCTQNNQVLTKRVPVLLAQTQYETLRRVSYETHTPMAELIRQAIDAWLAKQN
jgi:hypothetical protein